MTPPPVPSHGSSHVLALISDNIVPGIIVTVVGGLILAAILSRHFRSWLWRVVKWPFTIRVTTTRRLRAWEQRGRDRKQRELDSQRARPVARPRWVLGKARQGGPGVYVLGNAADDAEASDVELQTPGVDFQFFDAARWPEIRGTAMLKFEGRRSRDGELFGVSFFVDWTDTNGDRQREALLLPPASF